MNTPLFVYGTLKRGGGNHRFMAGQQFLGEARTVPGFRLFELSGYPGMVAQPADRAGVTGEVWLVTPACLAELDLLEGLAEGLYTRDPILLEAPFAGQRIETYLYAGSVTGRRDMGATWPV